jgi:hypothetical protein
MTTNGPETRWRLYVDESGKFQDLEDDVVVLGLLVRTDVSGTEGANLRRSLQEAAPELPWPLHAAELNIPIYHALAAQAGRPAVQSRVVHEDLNQRAVAILTSRRPRELATALSAIRSGHKLDLAVLTTLDQALRQASRPLYDQLLSRSRRALARVFRVMESLVRAGKEAPEGPAVMMFLGGEASRGDGSPDVDPARDGGSQRYLAILECVLARSRDSVARRGGRHNILLEVLSRPSFNRASQLGNVSRSLDAGSGSPVRLTAMQPWRFDAHVAGALVLADVAANRARRVLLHGPDASLAQFEDSLQQELLAPVRSGTPPLSNMAATGRARSYVEEARHGRPEDAAVLNDEIRRWAKDQALEWAAHFRGRHG